MRQHRTEPPPRPVCTSRCRADCSRDGHLRQRGRVSLHAAAWQGPDAALANTAVQGALQEQPRPGLRAPPSAKPTHPRTGEANRNSNVTTPSQVKREALELQAFTRGLASSTAAAPQAPPGELRAAGLWLGGCPGLEHTCVPSVLPQTDVLDDGCVPTTTHAAAPRCSGSCMSSPPTPKSTRQSKVT